MPSRMSRRGWFGVMLSAAIAWALGYKASAAPVRTEDTSFWEKVSGPTCFGGTMYETWCYRECAGGTCQSLWCEDRVVGTC